MKSFVLPGPRVYEADLETVYDVLVRNDPRFKENMVHALMRARSLEKGEPVENVQRVEAKASEERPVRATDTPTLLSRLSSEVSNLPSMILGRNRTCRESASRPGEERRRNYVA